MASIAALRILKFVCKYSRKSFQEKFFDIKEIYDFFPSLFVGSDKYSLIIESLKLLKFFTDDNRVVKSKMIESGIYNHLIRLMKIHKDDTNEKEEIFLCVIKIYKNLISNSKQNISQLLKSNIKEELFRYCYENFSKSNYENFVIHSLDIFFDIVSYILCEITLANLSKEDQNFLKNLFLFSQKLFIPLTLVI